MRKFAGLALVLLLMGVAYVVGMLSARTTVSAPPPAWADDSAAAQAWRDLLVSLEAGGATVFAETSDPRERVEGLSYLAQLASAALEMQLHRADPARPAFTDWMADHRKFLGDSPDATYLSASIRPEYAYRIVGNSGDASYLGFMLYGRSINGWNRAAGGLSLGQMQTDGQGGFELLLSRERPAGYRGNWLALDDDVHMVMVRQYFHDRPGSRGASVSIHALDSAPVPALDDNQLASRLGETAAFFNATLHGNLALMRMIASTPNTFDVPREYDPAFAGVFYPTDDNIYHGGWYQLAPGEALLIDGVAPAVDYWSVSLQNRWMQSLDRPGHRASLNNRDIVVDEDGHYRVVLAAEDPGVANWLDTSAADHGLVAIRYQLASEGPAPSVRWMPVSELRALLAQNTKAEQR